MDTIDKIFTSICKPFEKHLFTPLYRMLVRKKDHEISDDERKLIRLSQSQVILALPILLMTPISSITSIIQSTQLIDSKQKAKNHLGTLTNIENPLERQLEDCSF